MTTQQFRLNPGNASGTGTLTKTTNNLKIASSPISRRRTIRHPSRSCCSILTKRAGNGNGSGSTVPHHRRPAITAVSSRSAVLNTALKRYYRSAVEELRPSPPAPQPAPPARPRMRSVEQYALPLLTKKGRRYEARSKSENLTEAFSSLCGRVILPNLNPIGHQVAVRFKVIRCKAHVPSTVLNNEKYFSINVRCDLKPRRRAAIAAVCFLRLIRSF